jgi:hypothetical protein
VADRNAPRPVAAGGGGGLPAERGPVRNGGCKWQNDARSIRLSSRKKQRKLVIGSSRSTADVAIEICVNETTLGTWVAKYRSERADDEPPLNISSGPGCGN